MSTVRDFDYECTKKCRLRNHGHIITSALTKTHISDEQLAAFIAKTCRNFISVRDFEGRTALHMASSTNHYKIVEWLLKNGAAIDAKDEESGSTALHRAILYGYIDSAVLLIKHGADIQITDYCDVRPFEYICETDKSKISYMNMALENCDQLVIPIEKIGYHEKFELMVWGQNKNNNLGIESQLEVNRPHIIHFFRKENIMIKSVAMSSQHSVFLDEDGNIYAVGHGIDGKLGTGLECSFSSPTKVNIHLTEHYEKVIEISCSKNHTLLLTDLHFVYSCGLNSDFQLGISPPPSKLLNFTKVEIDRKFSVSNIIARDNYSTVYGSNSVLAWGTNTGQFDCRNENHFIQPTKLFRADVVYYIRTVASSKTAIAISIGAHISLYYKYERKSIRIPEVRPSDHIYLDEENDKTVTKVSKNSNKSTLKILVLTVDGNLYIWYESCDQFLRCILSPRRPSLYMSKRIIYKNDQIILLHNDEVNYGECKKVSVKGDKIDRIDRRRNSRKNASFRLSTNQEIKIELNFISQLDSVEDIFCDDDCQSFAAIQDCGKIAETFIFKSPPMQSLYRIGERDPTHDVVFDVGDQQFYAHKFIVFSRSKGLMSIIKNSKDGTHISFEQNLRPKMFEIILKYIYFNYFLTTEDLCGSFYPKNCNLDTINSIFLSYLRKFKLNILANHFQKHIKGQCDILKTSISEITFHRDLFPELSDVTIQCKGGINIKAHKCILILRLEYFQVMLSDNWSETNLINFKSFSHEHIIPMIDFLYSDDVKQFCKQNYSENFLYEMIVICDQFFVSKLKNICEKLLLQKISIWKCVEMLSFACTYNCEYFQECCLDFICNHLRGVLGNKILENCDNDVLKLINTHYRQRSKDVFKYRIITTSSNAVNDDVLLDFIKGFNINLYNKTPKKISGTNAKEKTGKNTSRKCNRQYERRAINAMDSSLLVGESVASNSTDSKKEPIRKIHKTDEVAKKEKHNWMEVTEKKNNKKKLPPLTPKVIEEKTNEFSLINLNNLLKKDEKQCIKVDKKKNVQKSISKPKVPAICSRQSISFGDFMPLKVEKLSQKQRKRLLAQSNLPATTSPSCVQHEQILITATPSNENNVKDNHLERSFADIVKLSTDTRSQSTSQDRFYARPSTSTDSSISTNLAKRKKKPKSLLLFKDIIEDEKRQKENYDKLINKKLTNIQIEESALAELRVFYNVDNAYDEIITIERKTYPIIKNFATWKRK